MEKSVPTKSLKKSLLTNLPHMFFGVLPLPDPLPSGFILLQAYPSNLTLPTPTPIFLFHPNPTATLLRIDNLLHLLIFRILLHNFHCIAEDSVHVTICALFAQFILKVMFIFLAESPTVLIGPL